MELDEMKLAWQQVNARLDALQATNVSLRVQVQSGIAARSLRRTSALVWYETVVNGLGLVLLGVFIARQQQLRFILPGLLLYPSFIALFASCVAQLVGLARLDFSGEVLAIQRRLEWLYVLRLRTAQMEGLFVLLLWVPLMIVISRAIGFDMYTLSTGWLAAQVALGVIAIPVLWALARRYGSAFRRSAVGRYVLESAVGFGLTRARARVAAIIRFAQER